MLKRFTNQAFTNDPEYATFANARIEGTVSQLLVIDDTDVAMTIPCFGKG